MEFYLTMKSSKNVMLRVSRRCKMDPIFQRSFYHFFILLVSRNFSRFMFEQGLFYVRRNKWSQKEPFSTFNDNLWVIVIEQIALLLSSRNHFRIINTFIEEATYRKGGAMSPI